MVCVYTPKQANTVPNNKINVLLFQVYQSEVAPPAGYYQQNIQAPPPRQGSPGQPMQTMQPVRQPSHPAQTSSARKRTAAIPIKSPQTEV
jgi:hypothetical protein